MNLPTVETASTVIERVRPWGTILNTLITISVIVAATFLAVLHDMNGEVVASLYGIALGHGVGVTSRRRPEADILHTGE